MDKTIYILTPGATLRRVGRRLLLEKDKERIFELPLEEVGRLLLYSPTEVTQQTIQALLECKIPLCYMRRSGELKGKVVAATDNHVLLRQRQYRLFNNPEFAMPLARAIIDTKLRNMNAVITHLLRRSKGTSDACQMIEKCRLGLPSCETREEIMGVEGAAARHYFELYGTFLPEPFRFKLRSRRPATDAANSLLNLGYMSLLCEVEGILDAHYFDPYLGVLHTTEERRSSLALDLLEEFRQAIVDLFVLRILNLEQLKPEHFHSTNEGGVKLTDEGIKIFFRNYEERLGKQDGDAPGLRKVVDEQVTALKRHLLGEAVYHHLLLENTSALE